MVWLDALDLPMIYAMEASYAIEGPSQTLSDALDASQNKYRRAGLLPYASLAQALRPKYPQIRFPWADIPRGVGRAGHGLAGQGRRRATGLRQPRDR